MKKLFEDWRRFGKEVLKEMSSPSLIASPEEEAEMVRSIEAGEYGEHPDAMSGEEIGDAMNRGLNSPRVTGAADEGQPLFDTDQIKIADTETGLYPTDVPVAKAIEDVLWEPEETDSRWSNAEDVFPPLEALGYKGIVQGRYAAIAPDEIDDNEHLPLPVDMLVRTLRSQAERRRRAPGRLGQYIETEEEHKNRVATTNAELDALGGGRENNAISVGEYKKFLESFDDRTLVGLISGSGATAAHGNPSRGAGYGFKKTKSGLKMLPLSFSLMYGEAQRRIARL
jgi:hypothetical protein